VAKPEELHAVLRAGEEARVTDWAAAISGWLAQIAERGGHHHEDHHHDGRRGPGMGGVLAAGVAGGLVLGPAHHEPARQASTTPLGTPAARLCPLRTLGSPVRTRRLADERNTCSAHWTCP
jgi:hypothetical protein